MTVLEKTKIVIIVNQLASEEWAQTEVILVSTCYIFLLFRDLRL